MIYNEKPEIFTPKFEASSCFIEHEGKILFLLRQDWKNQPNTYCLPSGKIDSWETPEQAMLRELYEETSIQLQDFTFFKKLYVKYDEYDFVYHIFHSHCSDKPNVILEESEHKLFTWCTPNDSLSLDLIPDEDVCIKMFYGIV